MGGYIKYVFRNKETNDYILCTRFPNWETPPIKLFSVGYLKYKEIIAGKDVWYNKDEGIFMSYNYDIDQFIDFVEEVSTTKSSIVL